MDGLSSAASVIQVVVVIVKAVEMIETHIQEYRGADKHVRELSEELRHTLDFLRASEYAFRDFHNSKDCHVPDFDQKLRDIRQNYEDLGQILQSIKIGDDVRKFKWLQQAKKCRDLQAQIEKKRKLLTELSTILIWRVNELYRHHIKHIPRHDSKELERFYDVERLVQGRQEIVAVEERRDIEELVRAAPESHQAQVTPSRRHSAGTLLTSKDRLAILPTRPAHSRNDACAQGCRCTCHSMTERRTSEPIIRPSIHPTVGRVGSLSFTRQCSVPDCQAAKNRQGQISYSFPSRLLHRVLTVSILYQGLKIVPSLRTPLFVSEYSDVIRYTLAGDLENLKRLFQSRSASINDAGLDGWSLLHTAAYYGRTPVVKYLLENNADRHSVELKNRKAVHFAMIKAVKKNSTDEEKELARLFKDAKEDFPEDFRLTPIHVSVLHLDNDSDKDGPSLSDLLDLVDKANNAPVDQDWSQWKAKYDGCSTLFVEILNLFHKSASELRASGTQDTGPYHNLLNQVDAHGWSPLHWAAYTGRLEEMKTLLEYGAHTLSLTSSKRNLFHHAAESGDEELIAHLIQEGYHMKTMSIDQADIWGETPLHIAATRTAGCVERLLQVGARVDTKQADHQLPLHVAHQADSIQRPKIVQMLVDRMQSSLIDTKDDGGRTPLFDFLKSPDCVDLLLRRGAKTDIRDREKKTLLHHACAEDCAPALQHILAHCDTKLVTKTDVNGMTPLLEAFARGSASCAALLLRSKAPIQPRLGKNGWNLLHHAARLGDAEVLELVLDRFETADLMGLTDQKESAEQLASGVKKYDGRVRELLQRFNREQGKIAVTRG